MSCLIPFPLIHNWFSRPGYNNHSVHMPAHDQRIGDTGYGRCVHNDKIIGISSLIHQSPGLSRTQQLRRVGWDGTGGNDVNEPGESTSLLINFSPDRSMPQAANLIRLNSPPRNFYPGWAVAYQRQSPTPFYRSGQWPMPGRSRQKTCPHPRSWM